MQMLSGAAAGFTKEQVESALETCHNDPMGGICQFSLIHTPDHRKLENLMNARGSGIM
jgi:hypothetical protein